MILFIIKSIMVETFGNKNYIRVGVLLRRFAITASSGNFSK